MPRVSIEEVDSVVASTNAPQMFLKLAGEHPRQPVLHSMNAHGDGSWNVWTLGDYADTTARAAITPSECHEKFRSASEARA